MNASKLIKTVGTFVKVQSPKILTGLGISAFVSSVIFAVKVTPTAKAKLDKKAKEKNEKLTPMEVVSETWKLYLPSAISIAVGTTCVISATTINTKRLSALSAVCAASDVALHEYKSKVKEIAGDETAKKVEETIMQTHTTNLQEDDILMAGGGNHNTRCYDPYSGRMFWSDKNTLESICNRLGRRMLDDMYISLNDYYVELGLPEINRDIGDMLGWHVRDGIMEFSYDSLLDSKDRPCMVVQAFIPPYVGYQSGDVGHISTW